MVIAPCSMKTLGAIAAGIADNLIHRAADVNLKEKRPLILLPRETPLNIIHLKNMYVAAKAGATIMPPSPSFYSNPQNISDLVDTVIARVLDHLKIEHDLVKEWGDSIV
jgi:4-hydroxy-3-polyprenylbenzoate decarboxylase